MDPVKFVFYGAVCGALASLAPSFSTGFVRLAIGVGVGVVSVFLLPIIRGFLGI